MGSNRQIEMLLVNIQMRERGIQIILIAVKTGEIKKYNLLFMRVAFSFPCLTAFWQLCNYLWLEYFAPSVFLTHWGRVTDICVIEIIIIGSDNGLSPGRRQAILWTNAGILLIGPLGTNFSETWIEVQTFSSKKIRLKMSSAKWRPFCLGLNVSKPSCH